MEAARARPSALEVLNGPSASKVELGRQLFVAKGCITCHANSGVARVSEYWVVDAGPNLTNYSASSEVLRVRLEDPASAGADTGMPNLALTELEIEALIAIINSD
jgi:mono/diheme cytochrome c family protein